MSNENLLPESKKSLLKWSDSPNTCEHQLPKIISMTNYNADTLDLIPGETPRQKYEWVQNQLSDKWIEIESEKDLPRKAMLCHFVKEGYVYEGTFDSRSGFRSILPRDLYFSWYDLSHYTPITKPNPPKP